MEASTNAMLLAAALGLFWAIVLGTVVAIRLYDERARFRSRRER